MPETSEPRDRKTRLRRLAEVPRFSIESAHVHPERLVVERAGSEIRLDLRQMELLVALAGDPAKDWTKDDLMKEAWRSIEFSDSMLHKNISILRDALGDDPKSPTCIQSLPKKGYRLIGQVRGIDNRLINPVKAPNWAGLNPYVGLAAFDSEHEHVFFGRDDLIKSVHAAIRRQHRNGQGFVLIVGSSGCGKTSLLQAGVLPPMRRDGGVKGLQALTLARCDFGAAQPGELLHHLAAALCTWQLHGRSVFHEPSATTLAETLTARPDSLVAAVDDAWLKWPASLRDKATEDAHLLLVIDHAEALVGKQKDDASDTQSNADLARERAEVETVVNALCSHPRVLVIAVVRGDYYAQLADALPVLMARKGGEGHVDVPLPQPAEITQMIRGPAAIARLTFDQRPSDGARLDDVLRDATIGQPDALPLLQHTLAALCEARDEQDTLTFVSYEALGGLEGALARRAEDVFQSLPSHVQQQLDAVLTLLIQLDGDTERVRGRSVVWTMLPDDPTRTLVNAFINSRLFVSGGIESRPDFRVAHEALLRQWPQAQEWIENNRRLLLAHTRLERAAARWSELGKRDDLLLNSGQPLGEALEVARMFSSRIDPVSQLLVRTSVRQHNRRRARRNLGLVGLAVLSLTTSTASIMALEARDDANSQRSRKERLLEYMLVDLAEELRPNGKLGVLERIATEATESLDQKHIADMSKSELIVHARALRTSAEVHLDKEKISAADANLASAKAAIRRALLLENANTEALKERGIVLYWIGYSAYLKQDYDEAGAYWEDYRTNSETLASMQPGDPEWIREQSYAAHNLATLDMDQGEYASAIDLLTDSARLKSQALSVDHNDKFEKEYIDTLSMISSAQEAAGHYREAASGYATQIRRARALIQKRLDADTWQTWLANALIRSALLESHLGHSGEAQTQISEAISVLQSLVARESGNKRWTRDLARAHMAADEIEMARNPGSITTDHLDEAISVADAIANDSDSPVEWSRLKALLRLRQIERVAPSPKRIQGISECVDELQRLHAGQSSDVNGAIALAEALIVRSEALLSVAESNASERDRRHARDLLEPHTARLRSPRLLAVRARLDDGVSFKGPSSETHPR